MILADTSVWIDHLRGGSGSRLAAFLKDYLVVMHPFVVGELALGSMKNRDFLLAQFDLLPKAIRAPDPLVRYLIDGHALFGTSLGYIDAHLLASARLMPDTRLWTRDRRLATAAAQLEVGFDPD